MIKSIQTLAVAAFLGLALLSACKQNKAKSPETAAATFQLANTIDPICDMKVDNTVEDTAHYHGKIYGFCSSSCKESFQAEPTKYVKE